MESVSIECSSIDDLREKASMSLRTEKSYTPYFLYRVSPNWEPTPDHYSDAGELIQEWDWCRKDGAWATRKESEAIAKYTRSLREAAQKKREEEDRIARVEWIKARHPNDFRNII